MGRFNPSSRLTGENLSVLIFDLIEYMGDELIKDYRDRMIDFKFLTVMRLKVYNCFT